MTDREHRISAWPDQRKSRELNSFLEIFCHTFPWLRRGFVEMDRPFRQYINIFYPGSGEVLLKRSGRYGKEGQNYAQTSQAGNVSSLFFSGPDSQTEEQAHAHGRGTQETCLYLPQIALYAIATTFSKQQLRNFCL